ncbi:MAG: hypothetical protein JW809_02195 [Pirellulales bacterium]|nr:hypothetical protein [Pirellulales bacterium]
MQRRLHPFVLLCSAALMHGMATTPSARAENLIFNGGAEDGKIGWGATYYRPTDRLIDYDRFEIHASDGHWSWGIWDDTGWGERTWLVQAGTYRPLVNTADSFLVSFDAGKEYGTPFFNLGISPSPDELGWFAYQALPAPAVGMAQFSFRLGPETDPLADVHFPASIASGYLCLGFSPTSDAASEGGRLYVDRVRVTRVPEPVCTVLALALALTLLARRGTLSALLTAPRRWTTF